MTLKKSIKIAIIILITIITGTITYIFVIDTPFKIPLSNVQSHREYQDNHYKTLTTMQYEKILKENPQSTYANYYVARLLIDDNPVQSLDLSKKGISIDANFGYNYLTVSYLHYINGDNNESLTYLNMAKDKGVDKYSISCRRILILNSMCTSDDKIVVQKLENMCSSYNSNYSFKDLQADLNYVISSGSPYLDNYKGKTIDCKAFLEVCKLTEENLENKRNLERLCSQSNHRVFLEDRFASLGNRIIDLTMINKMQDCVYMWNATFVNEYGSLSQCNILTGLSSSGNEIEVLKTNCYTP